jgi:hypothetical protein
MIEIKLPPLVGSREAANIFVSRLPERLTNEDVWINCRDLVSGSPSFADQLVKRLVEEKDARSLTVVGATDRFAGYFTESAQARRVPNRVHLATLAEWDVRV